MEVEDLEVWMGGYLTAWESNDPGDIGSLFTEDALYYTAPFREPWRGGEGIVAGWLEHRDEPDEWTFRWEVLAIADDLGLVRGWTTYTDPPTAYSNLWVIRLADGGRCSEFVEWWMEETPGPQG